MEYEFFTWFLFSSLVSMNNPAGLYRNQKGRVEFEALTKNRVWEPSEDLNLRYTQGDLDVEKISEDDAKKLLKESFGFSSTELRRLFELPS